MCTKNLKFTNELAEEIHKPLSKTFERRRDNINGIVEIWAADLIDMQAFSKQNKGIKYLLTIIDVFSKVVRIVPVKQNTGQEIANAIIENFEERKPTEMWVDKGREF